MLSFNDKISIRQLQILLILDIFGMGVIVLPRRAAEYGDQDAWIVILISTFIALGYTLIITKLGSMFPNQSFTSYAGKIMSKPIGIILSVLFIVKIILNLALELRLFGEIIKQTILFETPYWAICICMLLIGGFAAAKGYETRARIAEILIVVVFIPFALVFGMAAKSVDITNVMPIFVTEPNRLLIGGFMNTIAFTGIELCLLTVPYIQNVKNLVKGSLVAVGIIGMCMVFITLLTIAQFGYLNISEQMWPVIELMDAIDLPGSFIERQEAIIMSFWIISVFATVNAGLFFSSVLIKDCVKVGRRSIYILIVAVAILFISYIPTSITEVFGYLDALFLTFGVAYFFVIPLLLLLVAKMRGLGEKNVNKETL